MIGFLSNSFGRWQLKRKFQRANRIPEALNLSLVRNAVIVFMLTDEIRYSEILQISNSLKREEGIKQVDLLGFYSSKELPSYVDVTITTAFGMEEIGVSGIPKNDFAKNVLEQNFDLLLDFTPESFLPTDYFLALLDAKVKVGVNHPVKEYIFDLLIDTSIESPLLELSKNMIRYLKMINKA